MIHQPDWDALAELQFLLYNRIAGTLNEALSSIALTDMPEAQNKPPGYWKDRASNKISNVLNLFNAWSYLIRYKRGEAIPDQALRPFRVNALLNWLGLQLQLNATPHIPSDPLLKGNQETLQEALLLLHSVAYSQGTSVRVTVDNNDLGAWFRVKFGLVRSIPNTLDELMESFGTHWRAQDTAFELATARDFVSLNGCELTLATTALEGEFVFFVRVAGGRALSTAQTKTEPAQAAPSAELLSILSPEIAALLGGPAVEAAEAPAESTSIEQVTLADKDTTPVMRDLRTPLPVEEEPAPPTLDVLRPLPPTLTELELRATQRASEQAQDAKADTQPREGEAAVTDEIDMAAAEEAIIIPAKLPELVLPEHLSAPPAATSNGAAEKEPPTRTQSVIDAAKTQADPRSEAGESRAAAPDEPVSASNVKKGDA